MPAALARRLRIAWRLRRHALLAGFGLVLVALLRGPEGGAEARPEFSALFALSALILAVAISAVVFLLIALLPFLRNLVVLLFFFVLGGWVASALGPAEGSLAEIGRLAAMLGLVGALYLLPVPFLVTFRARRWMAVPPARLRAVTDPRGAEYWDITVESLEPDADEPAAFDLRYRKRGLSALTGRLRIVEEAPDRRVMRVGFSRWPSCEAEVAIGIAPEGEGARVTYRERVWRGSVMMLAMIWLDRALEDALDDIEDRALRRPLRSRRALEMPEIR